MTQINIIGAGIIGASLAYHLSRMGAKVTVFEAAKPANAASGVSFGWINASFYANPAHHRLRVAGIAAYHRLAIQLPQIKPKWCGTLWWEEQGAGFARKQADLTELGYPVAALNGAEVAAAEPSLASLPEQALAFPTEGACDASALTHALLAAAGCKLLPGIAAKSVIASGGKITGLRTAIGPFMADHTILAAGIGTPSLLATAGLDFPMLTRPGVLLYTKPVPFRLKHILVTPEQEIRQDQSQALLAPATANHQADTTEVIPDPKTAASATLERLRRLFNQAEMQIDRYLIGYRPVPADGLPAIGAVMPGLSMAVLHSGVTLAALVGEALAAEIMGQPNNPMFADFRPARVLRAL